MAKINSGILGGFSRTLVECVGYRRNGKSIIQSRSIKKNVNISSSLIYNNSKVLQIDNQLNLLKRSYQKLFTLFGLPSSPNYADLLRLNKHDFISFGNELMNPIVFGTPSQIPVPKLSFSYTPATKSLVLSIASLVSLKNYKSDFRGVRIESYNHNANVSLINSPINVNSDSIQIVDGILPSGFGIIAGMSARSLSLNRFSYLITGGTRTP